MNKLIAIVGVSGVGKTALVQALANACPFATAYEQHAEHPFQPLFENNSRFAFANQIDYLLLRAEQEKTLRASTQIGLIDGGLDLDFHGFTRLTSTSSAQAFTAAACFLPWHFDQLAARTGVKLMPMILAGHSVWAPGATILYLLRDTLEIK